MKRQHPKYIVKIGDTLENISEKFGVEESVWKTYHNNMCRLDDIISDKLPKGVQYIYLLPELWNCQAKINEKQKDDATKSRNVKFGLDNSIWIKKIPKKRVYRVKIEYLQRKSSIDYEIEAESAPSVEDCLTIKFSKSQYYINSLMPDMVLDEVAVKVADSIYPFFLDLNYSKEYRHIRILEDTYNTWIKKKNEIKKEYIGKIVENYLDRTEASLFSQDLTYKVLNNDVFFGLFTHSIYGGYGDNLMVDSNIRLSLGSYNSALNFKGKQSIESKYNNIGGVFLYFKGHANGVDAKTNKTVQFELNIEYNLEYNTFSIKDIICEIFVIDQQSRKKIVNVSIYQLRNKEK